VSERGACIYAKCTRGREDERCISSSALLIKSISFFHSLSRSRSQPSKMRSHKKREMLQHCSSHQGNISLLFNLRVEYNKPGVCVRNKTNLKLIPGNNSIIWARGDDDYRSLPLRFTTLRREFVLFSFGHKHSTNFGVNNFGHFGCKSGWRKHPAGPLAFLSRPYGSE
jgi:hypothetical protein